MHLQIGIIKFFKKIDHSRIYLLIIYKHKKHFSFSVTHLYVETKGLSLAHLFLNIDVSKLKLKTFRHKS